MFRDRSSRVQSLGALQLGTLFGKKTALPRSPAGCHKSASLLRLGTGSFDGWTPYLLDLSDLSLGRSWNEVQAERRLVSTRPVPVWLRRRIRDSLGGSGGHDPPHPARRIRGFCRAEWAMILLRLLAQLTQA